MEFKSFVICLFIYLVFTNAYSQELLEVNMNDKDCIHVIDGLVSSLSNNIPGEQLAHFEQTVSKEKLEGLGFSNKECVMVKSSSDLDIENFIYRKVHEQVQQIGTQYKIPVAVNGRLNFSYSERRLQLSKIKTEQIKNIKFLNKAEAQAKYGNTVVFGLIEITV